MQSEQHGIVVRAAAFLFARFWWISCRLFLHVRVRGLEHLPREGPVLVISNHPSYLEPVLFVDVCQTFLKRPVAFMAWDKLFSIPLAGKVIRFYGAYPVDLKNPGRKPYETLLRVLRSGGMAGIFPEGGRSDSDLMGEWKPGALRAALSTDPMIVPVSVIGARDIWPAGRGWPRLFRRLTMQFHPARKLETMGSGPAPSGSARDWLKIVEEALREEINRPILAARRKRHKRALKHYREATPANFRKRGELSLLRRFADG